MKRTNCIHAKRVKNRFLYFKSFVHFRFFLQSNLICVEEFHHNIQEMTNFPLRPFVLPFLRSHLPSLQRDLLSMARNNKQVMHTMFIIDKQSN